VVTGPSAETRQVQSDASSQLKRLAAYRPGEKLSWARHRAANGIILRKTFAASRARQAPRPDITGPAPASLTGLPADEGDARGLDDLTAFITALTARGLDINVGGEQKDAAGHRGAFEI
jgi:hypothetical protein